MQFIGRRRKDRPAQGRFCGLGTAGGAESKGVAHPHVLKEGSVYRMWYEGYDGQVWKLFYATSTDGIAWDPRGTGAGSRPATDRAINWVFAIRL